MCGWEILVNGWEFMEEFSLFNCIVRIPGIDYCEKNKDCKAEAAQRQVGMSYDGGMICKQADREGNCSYICS